MVFNADLGDGVYGLHLTIPQGTPADVTSSAKAQPAPVACEGNGGSGGGAFDGNVTVTSAYQVTACVSWSYETSNYPSGLDGYGQSAGWVGTAVLGNCP